MTYLNQNRDPGRRATAIVSVVAVHALLAAGLLAGLEIEFTPQRDRKIEATNIPLPPPTPEPTETPQPTDPVAYVPAPPRPAIDLPIPLDPPIETEPQAMILPEATRYPPGPAPSASAGPPTPPAFTPKRPAPRSGNWITDADYPRRALIDEAEGSVAYQLVIGTNGRVSACELTRSSGHRALDEATCRLLTSRARFDPATDENGAKVVGTFTGSVRWEIPE